MPLTSTVTHLKMFHQKLIELMNTTTLRRRSYNVPYRGICLGIASMAIQAILLGKEEYQIFCKRIRLLYHFLFDIKPTRTLTAEDHKDIDIFLEGVALYQEPYKYKCLVSAERTIINWIVRDYHSVIFQLIKPSKFDITKKNIYKFSNFLGCYELKEIQIFLDVLKHTINKVIIGEKIAFMLHVHNHIIALSYNNDNTSWTLIDANMLDAVDQLYFCEGMVKLLSEAFTMYNKGSEDIKLAIATDAIITTNDNGDVSVPQKIEEKFILELQNNKAWQQIHQITKSKLHRTNDGASWLYIAARNGQLGIVNQLIAANADVNLAKDCGITPLWVAVQDGYTEVAEALLKAHAKVDIPNSVTGTTPLIIASQNGYDSIVKLLINYKADVKKPNCTGVTPLLVASQNGFLNIVNDLIDANANLNASNDKGITPLWMAVKNKHFPVIESLLSKGAELIDPTNSVEPPSTTSEYDEISNNQFSVFNSHEELDSFFNANRMFPTI